MARGRPKGSFTVTYESMAKDLLGELGVADAMARVFFSLPEAIAALAAEGYNEKQGRRSVSDSAVQTKWRNRVSQMDRLHAHATLSEAERTEEDHAVPLDAVRMFASALKACWIASDAELIQAVAGMLKRCLIKIKLKPEEHDALNVDFKYKMPAGHEDLLTCDVLARYAEVFPDRVQALREQLKELRPAQ